MPPPHAFPASTPHRRWRRRRESHRLGAVGTDLLFQRQPSNRVKLKRIELRSFLTDCPMTLMNGAPEPTRSSALGNVGDSAIGSLLSRRTHLSSVASSK